MSGGYDLGGNIDNFAANRCGITANRYHLFEHVLFERFKKQKCYQHAIIKRRIGGKTLEGQLLKTKIFKATMGQFVSTSAMVALDNRFWFEPVLTLGFCTICKHW